MRGLDVRVAYANAKIEAIANPESDAVTDVAFEAEALGYREHGEGFESAPTMLADVPELVRAWEAGNAIAQQAAAMARCTGCNDGTGSPCRIHG